MVLAIAIVTSFALVSALPAPTGGTSVNQSCVHSRGTRRRGARSSGSPSYPPENDIVSGGDVLVQIDVSPKVRLDHVVVELNGADVTGAFRADAASHSLLGLVTGHARDVGRGRTRGADRALAAQVGSGPLEKGLYVG